MWTSVVSFLAVSVPEQFLMALFAWIILGKSETAKFRNVVFVGISAAILYNLVGFLFYPNYLLVIVPQVLLFAVLIYFGYRLSFIEALLGCLFTIVIFIAIQGSTLNLICLITGVTEKQLLDSMFMRIVFPLPEFILMGAIAYFLYRENINIHYFRKKKLDKSQIGRIRFLILQLTFALFMIAIIYVMFFKNIDVYHTLTDKLLIISSLLVTIIFTALLVKSVFKIGETIQKEEELKRRYDGREIIQNINYMCSLIDAKEYGELRKTLESIKNDIDNGMVNSKE